MLIGKFKVSVKVPCRQKRCSIPNLASLLENGIVRARGCTIVASIAMLLGNYRKHAEHAILRLRAHAMTHNGVAFSKLAPPWTVSSREMTRHKKGGSVGSQRGALREMLHAQQDA